jgi:tryptophan synthase alpha chain
LDSLSSGFLYAVSSSSTTGSGNGALSIEHYMKRLKGLSLKNTVLVGFGISNKEGFQKVCADAPGAVIGSAFIKALEGSEDVKTATKSFLNSILN